MQVFPVGSLHVYLFHVKEMVQVALLLVNLLQVVIPKVVKPEVVKPEAVVPEVVTAEGVNPVRTAIVAHIVSNHQKLKNTKKNP